MTGGSGEYEISATTVHETVARLWESSVVPSLSGLVRIPALSQAFDIDWATNGHLAAAVEHVRGWIAERQLPGVTLDVVQLEGRSPVLLVDVPATPGAEDRGTVVLYGHLDKQPPVGGWSEGLGPWKPVVRDDKLFGRGSVDDGYAGYAAATALEAVRAANGEHARSVILLETGEESGSPDLPAYLEHLSARLSEVSLVMCLDSGGNDYERLWLTTSLRGLLQVHVTVRVLRSAQHSGLASGIVPSSFRVLRQLLDRVEDADTGEIKLTELNVEIPANRRAEIEAAVKTSPRAIREAFPLVEGMRLVSDNAVELMLNNCWRPSLSVKGAAGLPEPADAGNVLRDFTTLALSFRLPPTADLAAASNAVEKALTTNVPYGAQVTVSGVEHAGGWNSPAPAPWLSAVLAKVSTDVFGAPSRSVGLGASIPFMGLLAQKYPQAQFLATGALGPDSNPHVPDEWLHLGQARRITEAVAHILDAHARG
ncbi:M20/M25/M40 family metallo-hydrolase [Pseudonocardia xinjiangensis]|uniref:M20/M25/M40 family metallo-hydrolase n=1 Tax=Pseudonocardia xinjiangensis TaxID=75289 RepID=UPI003D901584